MKELAKKIVLASKEIGSVSRTGYNDFQKYAYTKGEELFKVVREVLQKHDIAIIAQCTEVKEIALENKSIVLVASMNYTIIDAESGESMSCVYQGVGADTGDKGLYKAYTAALKYFLRDLFQIPFGDDPENEKPETAQKTQDKVPTETKKEFRNLNEELITEKQSGFLYGLLKKSGVEVEKALTLFDKSNTKEVTKAQMMNFMDAVTVAIGHEATKESPITENEYALIGNMILQKIMEVVE
jgi:hypothetical protein